MMNDYAVSIYADMKPVDRVLLYILKLRELFDLQEAMGERDFRLLKAALEREGAEYG